MTNVSAHTAPAKSGNVVSPGSKDSRCRVRLQLLALALLAALLVVGVAANYGPLHRYQGARDRLAATEAQVSKLEEQRAALQAELGKLSEAAYLEGLARKELTFTRPGEELYIVSGPSMSRDSLGDGDTEVLGVEQMTRSGVGASVPGLERRGIDGADRPGFLERMLQKISGFF